MFYVCVAYVLYCFAQKENLKRFYYFTEGKGTQCQLLSQRLQQPSWVHLSAGDLLRAERAKVQSALAKEINQYIDAGQLVPSHITCQLLINAMKEAYFHHHNRPTSPALPPQPPPVTHFLIDGFPRSQNNLDAWNTMTRNSRDDTTNPVTQTRTTDIAFTYHVQFVLNYTCPEETLIGRILERGKAPSARTDDNITTIQARFRTFDTETKPVLEYYQRIYHKEYTNTKVNNSDSTAIDSATIPVYTIPTDQPVEAVYQQTIQYFQ